MVFVKHQIRGKLRIVKRNIRRRLKRRDVYDKCNGLRYNSWRQYKKASIELLAPEVELFWRTDAAIEVCSYVLIFIYS